MAREIKYFSGSTGGTLYTVPTGRTAKVIFNAVNLSFSESVTIAGTTAYNSVRFGQAIEVTTDAYPISPGFEQIIAQYYSSSQIYIVNKTWYLGPGQTVYMTGSGAYSFMSIEEY